MLGILLDSGYWSLSDFAVILRKRKRQRQSKYENGFFFGNSISNQRGIFLVLLVLLDLWLLHELFVIYYQSLFI